MLWAHLLAFPLVMLGLPIYLDHGKEATTTALQGIMSRQSMVEYVVIGAFASAG